MPVSEVEIVRGNVITRTIPIYFGSLGLMNTISHDEVYFGIGAYTIGTD